MKRGIYTSEFWLTIATTLVALVTDVVPPTWKAVVLAVTSAAYTVSRGLAKMPAPVQPTPVVVPVPVLPAVPPS